MLPFLAVESFFDIAIDILLDAVKDTLIIVPFLLVTYVIMEWIEHKTSDAARQAIRKAGAAGPLVGSVLGVVPQCGFSAAAATLYAGRVVTLGTLYAVFLSTSDEMLPIFIAEQVPLETILGILGAKVVLGMILGFLTDLAMRIFRKPQPPIAIGELCEIAGCHCDERCAGCEIDCEKCHHVLDAVDGSEQGAQGLDHADDMCACGHEHEAGYIDAHDHHHSHEHHEHGTGSILMSAVKHTLQITAFIFVITLVLGAVLELVGAEALADFVGANPVASVFASALVGLIPNCAASVLIAQLYIEGVLGAGAMIAGLLVAAGVGLLVLVRTNRHQKQNAAIVAGLYAMGVVCGLIVLALGITF